MMHTTVVNKHHKVPYDVYVGRPTRWGNPFSHLSSTLAEFRVATRSDAIKAHRDWLFERILVNPTLLSEIAPLKGKRIACWCSPLPCHADTLAEIAEATNA